MRKYINIDATESYRKLTKDISRLPFLFTYDEVEYCGFSNKYFTEIEKQIHNEHDKETQIISFLLEDQLKIEVILTHYFSHGVTEWTVWFENISNKNSKILKKIQTEIQFKGNYPILKGILGDHVNQYMPYTKEIAHNSYVEFSSDSGRATHINFPYFNLEYGDGGAMLAIGWAGTWKASFTANGEGCLYTATSVNGLETYLKPHEKIRTALFVVAPYTKRDENYATNYWRDWFVIHNLPKADKLGNSLKPFSTCCLANDTGYPQSDGSISERYTTWRPSLEKMLAENVKVDFRWFDAGWYVAPDGTSPVPFQSGHDWWDTVGTWEFDKSKWPRDTFRQSTDFARDNGMKTIMWFEPERVTDPQNLSNFFGYDLDWAIQVDNDATISNNIGNPDCFRWTTDRICKILRDNKVEMYREDNNCDARRLWRYLDEKEGKKRNGITECRLIDAHYRMWDEIIKCTLSNDGCGFVDSCASGGGRNDLESMRRGVPILRSDSDRTSTGLRLSMTTSFNKWIPFCGANTKEKTSELALTGFSDKYIWRASYLPSLNIDSQFVQDPDQNFDILRFGLNEWKMVSPYLLKEFYLLTPWHKESDTTDFTAFCYFDAEQHNGVILAFRQENCVRDKLTVSLPFVESNTIYTIIDEDSGEIIETTEALLELSFAQPRTARLLWIKSK